MSKLLDFAENRDGTIAILAGLMLGVLVLVIGMAVDSKRQNRMQAFAQEAIDAAAIAGLREINLKGATAAEGEDRATEVFTSRMSEYKGFNLTSISHRYIVASNTNDRDFFESMVSGDIDASFLGIIGVKRLPIKAEAEVNVTPPTGIEVALVVDATGSMNIGGRKQALENAGKAFANAILTGDRTKDKNRKIAIVPFSEYVNVSPGKRNESWLDVPPDETTTKEVCETVALPGGSCQRIDVPCVIDGAPKMCTKQVCTGPTERQCRQETEMAVWRGCVGSRDHPRDVTDSDYSSIKVPGLLDNQVLCNQRITPLTNNLRFLNLWFDSLFKPGGETYLPSGILWGWRVLTPEPPFDEGADEREVVEKKITKAIVFMTDGENVSSPTYPLHDGRVAREGEELFREICKNIKDDNIVIYTVAFEVTDFPTILFLRECATTPDHFFNASNTTALEESFEAISRRLQKLSISG